MQWADSISSLKKIGVIQKKQTELRIYYDKKINKENLNKEGLSKFCKGKNSRDFVFEDKNHKNNFLFMMKRNYYLLTQEHINVESIKIC